MGASREKRGWRQGDSEEGRVAIQVGRRAGPADVKWKGQGWKGF